MRETETQRNWNEHFGNPRPPKTNIRWGLIIFMIVCIGCAALYVKKHPFENNDTANNTNTYRNINSSKNGRIMAESLDIIEDIFIEINKKDITTLYSDMTTLENINLSSEYNEYLRTVKLKLNYFINYRTTKDSYYLNLYNNVDMFSVLAEAFDKVGISYTLYNDRIEYTYNP